MLKIDAADAEIYTKSLNFTLSAIQLRKKKTFHQILPACLTHVFQILYPHFTMLTNC